MMTGVNEMRTLVALALLLTFAANAQTVWNDASDGAWSNALMWTEGVPDQNAAVLTNTTGSYTVTADTEPTAPFGNLTLANAEGNTTRLNVDAAGFTSTNGLLSIGQGAEVVVNAGGIMGYVGRTSTTPFVEVKNGGVWRVNGGSVNFADLHRTTPTSGNSQLYVGNGSTGRLEIVSGDVILTGVCDSLETNNTVSLRIGQSAKGVGMLNMTGGTLTTWNNDGSSAMTVGSGAGALGLVDLSGDAVLLASNAVNVASTSGTGEVTVAGNSIFRCRKNMRINVGAENGALGVVTVRENGLVDWGMLDGLYLGGYNGRGTGVVNVEGGTFQCSGITMNRANGNTGGYGEINVSAGLLGGFAGLTATACSLPARKPLLGTRTRAST